MNTDKQDALIVSLRLEEMFKDQDDVFVEDWFESMARVYGAGAVLDGLKNGTQDI
jgi:hypothetical protein